MNDMIYWDSDYDVSIQHSFQEKAEGMSQRNFQMQTETVKLTFKNLKHLHADFSETNVKCFRVTTHAFAISDQPLDVPHTIQDLHKLTQIAHQMLQKHVQNIQGQHKFLAGIKGNA